MSESSRNKRSVRGADLRITGCESKLMIDLSGEIDSEDGESESVQLAEAGEVH